VDENDGAGPDAISRFLASPAHHYDEDDTPETSHADDESAGVERMSLRRRLHRFWFEKQPSPYSSISPRRPDGSRTKIFFFNGSGKGR
jgi:hypothetical protein